MLASSHRSFADSVLGVGAEAGGMTALSQKAGLSRRQTSTRYSTRLLRYAIPLVWLQALGQKLGRPLRILEIGTGSGQMKKFIDAATPPGAPPIYDLWDGFDIAPQEVLLARAGYGKVEVFDADVYTTSPELPRTFPGYDAVLVLHVLEHLKDPEAFLQRITPTFDSGCTLIGGVPATPHCLLPARQARLRQKYLPGGHWCQFSSTRVANLLSLSGWSSPEITGAFLLRRSGSSLENSSGWMRWNLALAHRWPWWPGEVYFRATKNS
jgi:SAM-dependent methyltransferase